MARRANGTPFEAKKAECTGTPVSQKASWKRVHSQKFRTMSGVTYVATFNAVIGSRHFRKQVTLVPLPTSKL